MSARWPLLLVLLTPACVFPEAPSPCDLDETRCAPEERFRLDPSCVLDGSLQVQLGQGQDGFAPLGSGAELEVHYGAQGLQHVFLGARVEGALLDRYDRLELSFRALGGDGEYGRRKVVLGGDAPLEAEGSVVTATGFVVVLDWPPNPGDTFTLDVRDPCGQQGQDRFELPR